jgi:hypothetical protein
MKYLRFALALAAAVLGLRFLSDRIARHQSISPRFRSWINTEVHRINQR